MYIYSKLKDHFMQNIDVLKNLNNVLDIIPSDWLNLTTHRLDIYNESLAKVEFLSKFETCISEYQSDQSRLAKELEKLPTAFDYIRLGHPLSCILEWAVAQKLEINSENIISFSSQVMPIMAILRKNLFLKRKTNIYYLNDFSNLLNEKIIKEIYNYDFNLIKVESINEIKEDDLSSILISEFNFDIKRSDLKAIDFLVTPINDHGSICYVLGSDSKEYVSEIQHVRRRESIAMTPRNSYSILNLLSGKKLRGELEENSEESSVKSIQQITGTNSLVSLGSCGLSIQYAILMGLIHQIRVQYGKKDIKLIVPPNCYGGTNDQARRVAACIENVEIMDLPVDGGEDMASSVEKVLTEVAKFDAVPLIIAEIPTNPRVEVPNLENLKVALTKDRGTTPPVFILDQTFCPNIQFLGENDILSDVATISYVSGSKFPSGGLCTAGYVVANKKASGLMEYIDQHLTLCDNRATRFQVNTLKQQLPSMNKRIFDAYKNTRDFVDFIAKTLPKAKINFVSEKLALDGFTPSVFSLDLPTQGNTPEEREKYKRELNLKLISLMISEIPDESKYCVSYGQLKGCYWTIPATSTQGTTKEGDKDYIVRVAVSPDMNLEKHKEVFEKFCKENNL